MRRMFSVLVAGLVAGVSAHLAWFLANRPCTGDDLSCQLSWMRSELKLTDDQYARLRAVHEASSPRLLALANEVAQLRREYATFERERIRDGAVDFVEFAHYVERQHAIDRECLAATRQVVVAAIDTLTPAQRERYFGLLGPAPSADRHANPQ
jgi:hypothetical protein